MPNPLENKKWCYILVKDEEQPLGYRRFFVPSTDDNWQNSDLIKCITDRKWRNKPDKEPLSMLVHFHGTGAEKIAVAYAHQRLFHFENQLTTDDKPDIIVLPHSKPVGFVACGVTFGVAFGRRTRKTAKSFANMLDTIMQTAEAEYVEFSTNSLGNHLMVETLDSTGCKKIKAVKELTFNINSVPYAGFFINNPAYVADKLVKILEKNRGLIIGGKMNVKMKISYDNKAIWHGPFSSFEFIERFYKKCPPDLLSKIEIETIEIDYEFMEKVINNKIFADRVLKVCKKSEALLNSVLQQTATHACMQKEPIKTIEFLEQLYKNIKQNIIPNEKLQTIGAAKLQTSIDKNKRIASLIKKTMNFLYDETPMWANVRNKVFEIAKKRPAFADKIRNIEALNADLLKTIEEYCNRAKEANTPTKTTQTNRNISHDCCNSLDTLSRYQHNKFANNYEYR